MDRKVTWLAVSVFAMSVAGGAAAGGYQHGWKVYERPQPGYSYGGYDNPYGSGGAKSYGPGGGRSYGPGGGRSYGEGGGRSYGRGGAYSYGEGGGRNPSNPWRVLDD